MKSWFLTFFSSWLDWNFFWAIFLFFARSCDTILQEYFARGVKNDFHKQNKNENAKCTCANFRCESNWKSSQKNESSEQDRKEPARHQKDAAGSAFARMIP